MRPRAGPIIRAALRAGLLGAGAVGGYLLLNLFAGPAHADPADGLDIGGVLGDLPLVEPAEAPESAESDEPTDAPEVIEPVADAADAVTGITDSVTDVVTDAVAGTAAAPLAEVAGESVDQLVAGVDATVGSTVEPLTSTVDAVVPELVAPVPGGIADPPLAPVALAPPAPQQLAVAPQEVAAASSGPAVSTPARGSPSPLPASFSPVVTHAPDPPAGQAVAAPAAHTGHDPPPARPPAPPAVRTTQQLAGDSFDPGHPLPWTGPPAAADHEPDPDSLRSRADISYRSLVMPVPAPPG